MAPESIIHISPESVIHMPRNNYSHAPEYAIGIEVAMVVSDGDTDRAAYLGGRRLGVAPRIAAVVGVVGEIAAGVVAELSIAETNGAGARILRGVLGRLES